MLFTYKALTATGQEVQGTIDAVGRDAAIAELQKRALVISQISGANEVRWDVRIMAMFNRVSNKEVVILSRQMATLFQAQVSALRIFRLLGGQNENPTLQKYLLDIADTLQGGSSISAALSKYPDAFSSFYVNMVKAGEESGKLDEVFDYLADYLDRNYEVTSKAKNALIYPAFVIVTFVGVMILMLTFIIPKIGAMISDSGQPVPIFTAIVLWFSNLFINYGIFMAIAIIIIAFVVWRYSRTTKGAIELDTLRLNLPYIGDLYKKLYLSRIADNMNTMIISGIPMLRALEITSSVVDNRTYKTILDNTLAQVKGGASLSSAFAEYKEIPNIMVQMIKVGEETGELGNILKSLANFYRREVTNAVDVLISLIEPVMIVALGVGVGILLAAVLVPIYNIAATT